MASTNTTTTTTTIVGPYFDLREAFWKTTDNMEQVTQIFIDRIQPHYKHVDWSTFRIEHDPVPSHLSGCVIRFVIDAEVNL